MSERFAKMDACARAAEQRDAAALPLLLGHLCDADWRVRYAAAIALGDLGDAGAIDGLLALLRAEDAQPLYSQRADYCNIPAGSPNGIELHLPEGTSDELADAWRRRGRLKQAACVSLGAIGVAAPRVREPLERYVADEAEDYMVRAAAARALGVLGSKESIPALERATHYHEFCTRTEAVKALERIMKQG